MTDFLITAYDKLYRDLIVGIADKDVRTDISMEENWAKKLKPNAAQRKTMRALANSNFHIIVSEDGTPTIKVGRLNKRPKIPVLTEEQWLARRIPSEAGRAKFNETLADMKAHAPKAKWSVTAQHLTYDTNTSPPTYGILIHAWDISHEEWDAVNQYVKDNNLSFSKWRHRKESEQHYSEVWVQYPIEVFDGFDPETRNPQPFQNFKPGADE